LVARPGSHDTREEEMSIFSGQDPSGHRRLRGRRARRADRREPGQGSGLRAARGARRAGRTGDFAPTYVEPARMQREARRILNEQVAKIETVGHRRGGTPEDGWCLSI
jgi:hypothetical protein